MDSTRFVNASPSTAMVNSRRYHRIAKIALAVICLLVLAHPPLYLSDQIKQDLLSRAVHRQFSQAIAFAIDTSDEPCHPFLQGSDHTDSKTAPKIITPTAREAPGPLSADDTVASLKPLPEPSGAPSGPDPIFFLSFYPAFPRDDSFCAIEAAATANPGRDIIVYTNNETDFQNVLDTFGRFSPDVASRIHPRAVNHTALFRETPLAGWYSEGMYRKTQWLDQNLGNAARLAILWKGGGTYYDLDVIALNPLGRAARALALQDHDEYFLNNAALTFPRKDPFVLAAMQEFVQGWQGHIWGWQGPLLLTRTFRNHCPRLAFRTGVATDRPPPGSEDDPTICRTLTVYGTTRYYGVALHSKHVLEQEWRSHCPLLDLLDNEAIGLHLWHHASPGAVFQEHSLYQRVLARGCPHFAYSKQRNLAALSGNASEEDWSLVGTLTNLWNAL